MSFARYPRYKDSRVEWLGEVPEHWEVTRLRFAATINPSKTEVAHLDPATDVSFLPMEAIGEDGTIERDRQRTLSEVQSGYTYFRDGDVVVAKITPCFENGKGAVAAGLANGIGFGTTELIVARPIVGRIDSRFLDYLFRSREFRMLGEAQMYGAGGQKRVPDSFVRDFATGLPPFCEQHVVAAFLDRETAKIDALIAEQQRLIELLREKRQAVISNAVVPRVDERTTKLRHLIEVTPGFAFPSDGFSEHGAGHRLLRGVNVAVGACRWDETVYWAQGIDARIDEYQLMVGDLVLGMDRPWINEGTRIARIESSDLPALLVQRVARIRAKAGSSLEYIRIVLASQAFQSYLEADLTGVSVPHISERQIVSFPVRALSFDDQVRIAANTMSSTSAIDNLIATSQRAIALLQERRTALISAAVTGKIDVRGLAMAEAA